ncbi:MAG: Npun_R2479 family HD domain-containing metalloprotein [Cyanobacteria bacterium P01_G01_bin.54]
MFNLIATTIEHCTRQLRQGYADTYGSLKSDYAEILSWATQMALESIAQSDAPYHDVEHTVLVTLTGQEILRGKHLREGGVTPEDWLHCILSLLCHDIGYIKGLCGGDRPQQRLYTTGLQGELIKLAPGATDASLTPYHVDRGKQFVLERFGGHRLIDVRQIQQNIELTRFPIPQGEVHQQTQTYPGLIRAADLLGQLADPRYLQKLSGLFQEFVETGAHQALGYANADELRAGFPEFYRNVVQPYVGPGLAFLNVTQSGQQVVANLYANLFKVEQGIGGQTPRRHSSPPSPPSRSASSGGRQRYPQLLMAVV